MSKKTRARIAGNIAPELQALAVPVDNLKSLDKNPRRGDVQAVAASYEAFGQRKPIVARRTGENENGNTGEVIAGNHQLAAARKLGWEKIAVVWTDDDDVTAKAYALADNRTAELGHYDIENLAAMVDDVSADAELMKATGWTADDLAKILTSGQPEAPSGEPEVIADTYAVVVYCRDEAHQTELIEKFLKEGLDVKGLMS